MADVEERTEIQSDFPVSAAPFFRSVAMLLVLIGFLCFFAYKFGREDEPDVSNDDQEEVGHSMAEPAPTPKGAVPE